MKTAPLPVLLLLVCASCMVQRSNDAESMVRIDADPVAQLAACDAVAPTDPAYPEARRRALQLEEQLRESNRLLYEGLLLRSEGRDEAALHCFHGARAIWPAMPGLQDWIRATEARQRIFVAAADGANSMLPQDAPDSEWRGSSPGFMPVPLAESAPVSRPGPASPAAVLARAESRLRAGDLDGAIAALRSDAGLLARESALQDSLFSLLRQRGLLAYGRGDFDRAVVDWVDALEMEPDADEVRRWVGTAMAEAGMAARKKHPTANR